MKEMAESINGVTRDISGDEMDPTMVVYHRGTPSQLKARILRL